MPKLWNGNSIRYIFVGNNGNWPTKDSFQIHLKVSYIPIQLKNTFGTIRKSRRNVQRNKQKNGKREKYCYTRGVNSALSNARNSPFCQHLKIENNMDYSDSDDQRLTNYLVVKKIENKYYCEVFVYIIDQRI